MGTLNRDVEKVASRYLEALDTPVALGVYLRVKYGEWEDLASCKVDPQHYLDSTLLAEKFRRDYQAVSLLRKFEGLPIARDLEKEAVEAFLQCEKHCKVHNLRLQHLEHPVGIPDAVLALLHRLRKNVARVLGPLPGELDGRHGPGGVFEFGRRTSPSEKTFAGKMIKMAVTTPAAHSIVEHTLRPTMWMRSVVAGNPYQSALKLVPGNRFTTVPKDALKKRGICLEPSGSVFAQLGVGKHLSSRLRAVTGINIPTAQEIHATMACTASLTGSHATIDLSSASDTICRQFVKLALGYAEEWFHLLDDLRSPKTRVKLPKGVGSGTSWVWLEKFSSMGNGFTFELETILFHCLACAAAGVDLANRDFRAYGDDIIVPTEHADAVLSALKMFGFIPNPKKTFTSGPFRESCGGDYFLGRRVTPYYLKVDPTKPSDWISIANSLYADVQCGVPSSLLARRKVGLPRLPLGPVGLGDIVLHERDSRRWLCTYQDASQGPTLDGLSQVRWFRAWVPIGKPIPLEHYPPYVQLTAALYGAPSTGLVPRDAVAGYRWRWVPYS